MWESRADFAITNAEWLKLQDFSYPQMQSMLYAKSVQKAGEVKHLCKAWN